MKQAYASAWPTHLTKHAVQRAKQRGIPLAAIELLLDFAKPTSAGGGALTYRFSEQTWSDVESTLGPLAEQYRKFRNCYVVEAEDGSVITVAWLN